MCVRSTRVNVGYVLRASRRFRPCTAVPVGLFFSELLFPLLREGPRAAEVPSVTLLPAECVSVMVGRPVGWYQPSGSPLAVTQPSLKSLRNGLCTRSSLLCMVCGGCRSEGLSFARAKALKG